MAPTARFEYPLRMKILIVSWYYPPANTIAAVRLAALSRTLSDEGWDVRVLTARDIPFPQTLPTVLPSEQVVAARWFDAEGTLERLSHRVRGAARDDGTERSRSAPPASAPAQPGWSRRLRGTLRRLVEEAVFLPDKSNGWIPYGYRAGRRLLDGWRPDLIFASGPPFSGCVIGHRLSRRYGIPLVTELRDRWSDDPYYPPSSPRRWIDRRMEERILRASAGISTVSEPWADSYRARFGKPTQVVYNGYDPELLGTGDGGREGPVVVIVYTGGIYPGRRDPAPLFEAIRALGDKGEFVRVEFYGTPEHLVRPLAEAHGVAERVVCHPAVPHAEIVHIQQTADVLLLMQWNDPREQGNVPGKFFEYIGTGRPILILGLEGGVPDTLARERQAGVLGRDPAHLAAQLEAWIAEKRDTGRIAPTPAGARQGLSRREQSLVAERFLRGLVSSG